MDVGLLEDASAGIQKAVRGSGFDDEDVAGLCVANFISSDEARGAFVHNGDLIVVVDVQWSTAAGLGFDEEDGDCDVSVIGADEPIRAADDGQILFADEMHGVSEFVFTFDKCCLIRPLEKSEKA